MSRIEERQRLEAEAEKLRSRLVELRTKVVPEIDRPAHEVAVRSISDRLTAVGRQLQNSE